MQQYTTELSTWLGSIFRSVSFDTFRSHLDTLLKEESVAKQYRIIDELVNSNELLHTKQCVMKLFNDYKEEKFSADVSSVY